MEVSAIDILGPRLLFMGVADMLKTHQGVILGGVTKP